MVKAFIVLYQMTLGSENWLIEPNECQSRDQPHSHLADRQNPTSSDLSQERLNWK